MTVVNAMPNSFTQLTTIAQWEKLMLGMGIVDGVAGQPSSGDLKVTLNSGARTAIAAPGYAFIRGQIWGCDAPVATAIPAASASPRIDLLVLRLDRQATTAVTIVQPVVITGTPSATPAPPAMLSTTRYQDILLGQWQSNADASFTGLIDARKFSGSPVEIFSSTYRPTPSRLTFGFESNTGKLLAWNGSSWKYLTAPFAQVTAIRNADFGLPAIGSIQEILSVPFSTDGLTDIEISVEIPGIYRSRGTIPSITVKGTVGSGANVVSNAGGNPVTVPDNPPFSSAHITVWLDSTQLCQKYMGISGDVGDSVAESGCSFNYRTSTTAGNRPSAGAHTVHLKANKSQGDVIVTLKAGPIQLQVSPVYQ
jgi:hypothetical protein